MMLDPSLPASYGSMGDRQYPLLHAMATNTRKLSNGSFVLDSPYPYIPPAPPTAQLGEYYFLMFEQKSGLTVSNLDAYTSVKNCPALVHGR